MFCSLMTAFLEIEISLILMQVYVGGGDDM